MNNSSDGDNNGSSGESNRAHGNGNGNSNDGVVEPDANALLPRYLYRHVRHYHDDFYVSRSFDPQLVVQLMSEGFLPIATRGYLLPKLHVERCVLQLNPRSNLHISRSTRKKSKRFRLSVNESFDEVVAGCHKQHGANWLYPPIVASFRAIHQKTIDRNSAGVNAMVMANNSIQPQDTTPVRFYTVEVWNAETGALAGGELGYSVGGIYSSLTGFSNEDAAGSVQLVALGKLLTKCGFEYWDLGMDLEYKRRLGAEMMRRAEFVSKVKRTRVENKGVVLQCGGGRTNAKELVDWVQEPRIDDTIENHNNTQPEGKEPPPQLPSVEDERKPRGKKSQSPSDNGEGKNSDNGEGKTQPPSDNGNGKPQPPPGNGKGMTQPPSDNGEENNQSSDEGSNKKSNRKRPHEEGKEAEA